MNITHNDTEYVFSTREQPAKPKTKDRDAVPRLVDLDCEYDGKRFSVSIDPTKKQNIGRRVAERLEADHGFWEGQDFSWVK